MKYFFDPHLHVMTLEHPNLLSFFGSLESVSPISSPAVRFHLPTSSAGASAPKVHRCLTGLPTPSPRSSNRSVRRSS